jgi:polysaccharide export outer membrane protein
MSEPRLKKLVKNRNILLPTCEKQARRFVCIPSDGNSKEQEDKQNNETVTRVFMVYLRHLPFVIIMFSVFTCGGKEITKPVAISSISHPKVSAENVMSSEESTVTGAINSNDKKNNFQSKEENPLEQSIHAPYAGDYVLGPEDLIEINVFQVEELKRTVRISSNGYIKLPLAGVIKAAGFTGAVLEAAVSKKLEQYIQEPVVSVFVMEYRSQRITVLGAVTSPGTHVVTGQKYLLDLLSLSEGLAENTGDICYIQRGKETIVINLSDLLINGDARLNIPVFTGDIIHVAKSGTIFVDGGVNRPGSFIMPGKVTLTQAIAMAGGLKFEGSQKQIRVYRDIGSDEKKTIDVDYDTILSKQSTDIDLQDKDIVIIPVSGPKRFFEGFVRTARGLISFGKSL